MITKKVKSSTVMPIKSTHMVEVLVETDGEAVSGNMSLSRSYKSVQVLGVGVLNRNATAYTGAVSVQLVDNATIAVAAPAVANSSPRITITLICEV
jgi:hypothetical protein